MSGVTHITALLLVPAASKGSTADLYLKDPGGGSLLSRGLAGAMTWPVDEVILLLGDDAETLLDAVGEGVDVLMDPEWEEGPAAALRSGFDLVVRRDRSDAVIVVSLDRPVPDGGLVEQVIETARVSTRPIVAAKYRYAFDFPYLVRPELWGRMLGLEGGASLPSVVAAHPDWIAEAWIDRVPPGRFESVEDLGVRR